MTGPDRLPPLRLVCAMIRSDHEPGDPSPGPAPAVARVRVRRPRRASSPRCGRCCRAPPVKGGARRSSPASRARARAGSSASSPESSPTRARSSSTATATRSSDPRTGRSPRRSSTSPAGAHGAGGPRPARRLEGRPRAAPARALAPGPPTRRRSSDADTERHRLHTAVTDCSSRSRHEAPVLLVLEDVHWADASTLLLIRHLVRSGAAARMLLVATFRDAEADCRRRALRRARRRLPDGGRGPGPARRPRRAASSRSSSACRPAPSRRRSSPASSASLTGGNAFLVTELWRELVDSGAVAIGPSRRPARCDPRRELGTPDDGARGRQPAPPAALRAATIGLLELAAVAGTEFELDDASATPTVLEEAALLDAVDEAVRAGLLVEEPGTGLAYRFAHELVRRAVADRLSRRPNRRAPPPRRRGARARRRPPRPDGRARCARLPLRGRGPARRRRARRRRTTSSPPSRRSARSRSTRPAARFRTALELGLVEPAATRGRVAPARRRVPSRRRRRGGARRVSARPPCSPARSATTSCSRVRRSASRRPAGGRRSTTRGAVELLEEAAAALGAGDSRASRARARRPRACARPAG